MFENSVKLLEFYFDRDSEKFGAVRNFRLTWIQPFRRNVYANITNDTVIGWEPTLGGLYQKLQNHRK